MLAHQGGLEMPEAYRALVQYARDHNLKLADLARALVQRALPPALVLDAQSSRRPT